MKYVALVIALLPSCVGAGQYTRDANDALAELLCARHNAAKASISLEDARRIYCISEPLIRPWLELVKADPDKALAGVATKP